MNPYRHPRLTLAALLTVLVAGCGGPQSGSVAGGSAAPANNTLTVATADGDLKSLDTAQAYDTWSTAVVHACTRRLVDYDADGKLVPDLAAKWNAAPGGLTYTFHLRAGEKFADGTPIEARHFKAALDRIRDPKTAAAGADFYSAIAAVDAPDASQLVVRLKAPEPTLLNVLAMTFAAPLPDGQPSDRPDSGPYFVETYDPGQSVVLAKNPHYSGPAAPLDRIVLQLGVAEPLQLTRFRSGEVDLLPSIPPAEYGRVMGDPALRDNVAQGVVNQTWYFGMNVSRTPWSDARVRRAAFLAIDRERHARLSATGKPANGILPPRVPGYDPARVLPKPDPAAAKRLLAQAGYPNGLPQTQAPVLVLAANDQYQRHAEAIQSDLRAVGIPLELRSMTLSEYLTAYRTNADCWFGGWYPDFPDAGNFFIPVLHGKGVRDTGKSPNAAHYRNAPVDELLSRAAATPLGPEREKLFRKAEDLILEDLPWIPLYFETETRYFRDGVTGVRVHPIWRQILTGIGKG